MSTKFMDKQTPRARGHSGKFIIISVFVCFAVVNLISTTAAAVYELEYENLHEQNHNYDINEYFENIDKKMMTSHYYEEFVVTFDYTLEELLRDGQAFNRLCLVDGGIECGTEGVERQFYKHIIKVSGELNSVSITFYDPIHVRATPTPYRTPTILGMDEVVLDYRWKGYLENEISASWELQHLSKTTVDDNLGELYSLKMYPVEYQNNGKTVLYKKAKISYHATEHCYWSSTGASSGGPDPGHKPTGPIKYLILTHSDLVDVVKPFANWKSQKGIFTEVITTAQIDEMYDDSMGDLQCKMRKYIQQSEQTYDLDYLFLVGDWDKVPTRNTKNSYANPMMGEPDTFASDLYFACVDPNTTWNKDGDSDYAEDGEVDDSVPDMAVGRLAINSPSILSSVLNNLQAREKNLTWDPLNMVSVYMAGDPGYMPGDSTDVMDYFYDIYGKDVFSDNITIYYDESGKLEYTSKSVESVLNDHHTAMCYFGHGQPTGLPELFENNNIPSLENNGTDGSLFAMACLTGWFDDPSNSGMMGAVDNCFAEVLTETPGKGLVGYIGSSRMAVGYIDTVYSDDAPGLEEDYWRSVHEAAKGNITPTIGDIWCNTMTNFVSSFFPFKAQGFDNPGLRTFLEYNLLGEPEAPLIFNEPDKLALEYTINSRKTSVWAKVTNASGSPVPGATVCIYRAGELGRAYKTDSKGETTFIIPPNNGGVINITASKPGDRPTSDSFTLPDTLAPKQLYSMDPEDPDGNNGYYISCPTIELFGDEYVDVEYKIDNEDVQYTQGSAYIQVPNGEHTVKFRVRDQAGHWSAWKELVIVVDQQAPELLIKTDPNKPNGNADCYVTKPVLTLKSNEQLNDSYYKLNNDAEKKYESPIEIPEGGHEVTFRAFDLAGNMNTTKITIKVDLTAPSTSVNVSHQPDGENGYYKTPPTIEIYPNGEQEEFVELEYRWDTGAWKVYQKPINPPEGTHTLYYRGIDVAGNVETSNSVDFIVDTEAPEVSIIVSPSQPDGMNDYYVTYPIVEFESLDGIIYYYLVPASEVEMANDNSVQWSEAEAIEFHDYIMIPEGEWYLYSMAIDPAGNQGDGVTQYFKVDTTSPNLNWELTPETPDGDDQWYRSHPRINVYEINHTEDVLIYWADNKYNEWTEYNEDMGIVLPSGEHVLRFQAVDLAGNKFITELEPIKVDTEPPELNIETPIADETTGRSVLVSWSGSDELSKIGYYKVRLDEKAWNNMYTDTRLELEKLNDGEHKVTIRAWDAAGNSIQVKQTFTVDAEGPKIISRTPVGQNVPVNSMVILEFSEEMDADSAEITIDGIDGTLFWENNTAIFVLTRDMQYSAKYTIHITGADQHGNQMSRCSWTFETMPKPESEQEESIFFEPTVVLMLAGILGVIIVVVLSMVGVYLFKIKKN